MTISRCLVMTLTLKIIFINCINILRIFIFVRFGTPSFPISNSYACPLKYKGIYVPVFSYVGVILRFEGMWWSGHKIRVFENFWKKFWLERGKMKEKGKILYDKSDTSVILIIQASLVIYENGDKIKLIRAGMVAFLEEIKNIKKFSNALERMKIQ